MSIMTALMLVVFFILWFGCMSLLGALLVIAIFHKIQEGGTAGKEDAP